MKNECQEAFCRFFTDPGSEFYGNGTQSYVKAYGIDITKKGSYDGARQNAHKLLTKKHICDRINELLEEGGFNDQNVDKQHLFLINQHADLKTKLGAIKEYNNVRKRTEPNKVELSVDSFLKQQIDERDKGADSKND